MRTKIVLLSLLVASSAIAAPPSAKEILESVRLRQAQQEMELQGQLREGGTGVASAAVVLSILAVCVALTAALSVGFYELVLLYQHSR